MALRWTKPPQRPEVLPGQLGFFDAPPKPDPPAARAARDAGVQQVVDHNADYTAEAIEVLKKLLGTGRTMTGEEARIYVVSQIGPPRGHHNIWGAVLLHFRRNSLITYAGQGRMKTEKSHARMTPLWRF